LSEILYFYEEGNKVSKSLGLMRLLSFAMPGRKNLKG
jgi:hypothetical protein